MSGSARVELAVGARVLQASGPAMVIGIERHGVRVRDVGGNDLSVAWEELTAQSVVDGKAQATHESLEPWWSGLHEDARAEALSDWKSFSRS